MMTGFELAMMIRFKRKSTGIIIGIAATILMVGAACRFPGALAQRVAPETGRTATPAAVSLDTTRTASSAGPLSTVESPAPPTSTQPGGSSLGQETPAPGEKPTESTANPGVSRETPTGTETSTSPEATESAQAAATQPATASLPLAPGESPYPGADAPQITPLDDEPYPFGQVTIYPGIDPGVSQPSATIPAPPTPQSFGATPPVPLQPSSSPTSPFVPPPQPFATPQAPPAPFPQGPAPQVTLPTPTQYTPPTPLPSPTPTPTRTLVPPPPWVRVPLRATDPRSVKLASGKVQLVEFFAYWSGPSQAMAPLIQGLEDAYGDEVNFVYLDIDDPATDMFQRELRFRTEPHFFLLGPDGRVLRQWEGYVTTAALQAAIHQALD